VKQERERDSKKSSVTQTQPLPLLPVIDRELELFRLQIVTELIKMHITAGKKITSSSSMPIPVLVIDAAIDPVVKTPTAKPLSSPAASIRRTSLPSSPSTTAKSTKAVTSRVVSPKESQKDTEKEKVKDKGDGKKGCMDVDTIEQHLDSSLLAVEAIAGE
jgi:hypothetical protein